MTHRAAIPIALLSLCAVARAGWSPEWTDGTQTNVLFQPEPHHYMELVKAVNERVIAANFSQSDFWNEGSTRPPTNNFSGRWHPFPNHQPSPIVYTNGGAYAGYTNEFWRPTAESHGELVAKIVECSRYFAASNFDDYSFIEPFQQLVGDDFDDIHPRWVYEMAESMDAHGTNWNAMTNPPLAYSLNPTNYYGGWKFQTASANESAYVLKLPVNGGITGEAHTIPRQLICRAEFVPTSNNSYLATMTNTFRAWENGAWEYDRVRVRLDPTNYPYALGPGATLYWTQGNESVVLTPAVGCGSNTVSPDNANHGSSITNVFNVETQALYIGVLSGDIETTLTNKYITSAWFSTGVVSKVNDGTNNFPLGIVAEYIDLKAYGSEEYGLRKSYSDWVVSWPELVYLRGIVQEMKCVPAMLAMEHVGVQKTWQTNATGTTSFHWRVDAANTSPGYSSCGDLPSIPTGGNETYFSLRTNATLWVWTNQTWTNVPDANVGPVEYSANTFPSYSHSWNVIDRKGNAGWIVGAWEKWVEGYVESGDFTATTARAQSGYIAHDYRGCVKVPDMYLTCKMHGTDLPRVSGVKHWSKYNAGVLNTNSIREWSNPCFDSVSTYTSISVTNEQILKEDEESWSYLITPVFPTTVVTPIEYVTEAWADESGTDNCWEEAYTNIPSHWLVNSDPTIIRTGTKPVDNLVTISTTSLIFFEYEYP